jgi:hypothetical protein
MMVVMERRIWFNRDQKTWLSWPGSIDQSVDMAVLHGVKKKSSPVVDLLDIILAQTLPVSWRQDQFRPLGSLDKKLLGFL